MLVQSQWRGDTAAGDRSTTIGRVAARAENDSDSLPDYEVLDAIIARYVEQDESIDEIVAAGYPQAVVQRVARLVDRNEYKRRQVPPGVKITRRAYGRDRRYPIVNGF